MPFVLLPGRCWTSATCSNTCNTVAPRGFEDYCAQDMHPARVLGGRATQTAGCRFVGQRQFMIGLLLLLSVSGSVSFEPVHGGSSRLHGCESTGRCTCKLYMYLCMHASIMDAG